MKSSGAGAPSSQPSSSFASPHYSCCCTLCPTSSPFSAATPPLPNPPPWACFCAAQHRPRIAPLPCGCAPFLFPCIGPPCSPHPSVFGVPPSSAARARGFIGPFSDRFAAPGAQMEPPASTHAAGDNCPVQSVAVESEQACPDSDRFESLRDGYDEGEEDGEEDEPQFVLSDEWAEFFAKSEARRREKKAQLRKAKQAMKQNARPSIQQEDELHMPTLPDGSFLGGMRELKASISAESSRS